MQNIDDRLRKSARTLRAWRWMSRRSTRLDEVVELLTAEALELIELGRRHPERAKDIGKLIVAYHRLIVRLKDKRGTKQPSVGDVPA